MVRDIPHLRTLAVKHILRRDAGGYLLRHSLGKPWVASEHLNELAWTDFERLYFNFPKIRAAFLRLPENLDPAVETVAHLAAVCHEILHNLWLHKYRGKDKYPAAWRVACEWAINFELAKLFGDDWINHLGVMYPHKQALKEMGAQGFPTTTDGFYEYLTTNAANNAVVQAYIKVQPECGHCDRNKNPDDVDTDELIRSLINIPESQEKSDIIKFIADVTTRSQSIPWEMLLLGGIENAVNMEQTWAWPSRKNEEFPGWRHEKLLSFVWVLDVSPSIDDDMKKSFMATLQAGINLYHDAMHRVIFFADGIVKDVVISSGTNLNQIQIPRGSGTCLEEVWEVLEKDLPEYALVLTDLELRPVPKPSYTKIVWGIVNDNRMFDPDYGIKIELK